MTYTPEELERGRVAMTAWRQGPHPDDWEEVDRNGTRAVLDAVLPDHDRQPQDAYYALGYIDAFHDEHGDGLTCRNRGGMPDDIDECSACREYGPAAALAAPVEPEHKHRWERRPGESAICLDCGTSAPYRAFAGENPCPDPECPCHGPVPAPPVEQP